MKDSLTERQAYGLNANLTFMRDNFKPDAKTKAALNKVLKFIKQKTKKGKY